MGAARNFAIAFREELDIARTRRIDHLAASHVAGARPDGLRGERGVPPQCRQRSSTTVAHTIYPGDYLHMAILSQRTYAQEGPARSVHQAEERSRRM